MEDKIAEECALYFQKNDAYSRMFMEMKKKFIKTGKLSGNIRLGNLSEEECRALGAVFGKSLLTGEFRFSISELEAALQETKYRGTRPEVLLEKYFGERVRSNSQKKEEQNALNIQFWVQMLAKVRDRFGASSGAALWADAMWKHRAYGYQLIVREKIRSQEQAEKLLMDVCAAMEYLADVPEKSVRLAVLGAEITKNPHYFDRSNAAGRLLVDALSFRNNMEEPKGQEDVLALYYMSGICPDDISSSTTCYGIHFYENGREHEAYRYFIEKGEKYVLTLSNLSRLTGADSVSRKVFVIENQMVFSQVCDELNGQEYAVMCTSGQMKTASLILIDMLTEAGCELYYCGDTDPEGIEIADRVTARDPKHIFLWRMSAEDYYRSVSNEILTEARLRKLDKIENAGLRELVQLLKKEKRAGYQEHLIGQMTEDIRRMGQL